MMQSKQRGMTLTNMVIVVFVVGFFLTIAMKLLPHYLDNTVVQGALEQAGSEGLRDKKESEIRAVVGRYFMVNNIRDISPRKVKMVQHRRGTKLVIDYEKRLALFGNVDVVLIFHNEYDSAAAGN